MIARKTLDDFLDILRRVVILVYRTPSHPPLAVFESVGHDKVALNS